MSLRFDFRLRKTIGMVVMVGLLIGLGVWQLQRREWKEHLIATIAERQTQAALTSIPKGLNADGYIGLDYRRAELTGLVDETKVVYLGPRTYEGQAGYHQLVPMFLANDQVILINEGYVPTDWALGKHNTSSNVQSLSGTLRLPALPGRFTPNNPAYTGTVDNRFYWIDLRAMGDQLNAPHLLPVIFEVDRLSDAYPLGGQAQLTVPNDHLQYALTWFTLALACFVMYLISSFHRVRRF